MFRVFGFLRKGFEMGKGRKVRMMRGRLDEGWSVIAVEEMLEIVQGAMVVVRWRIAVPERIKGKVLDVEEDKWFGVKVAADGEAPRKANYSLGYNGERFARSKEIDSLVLNRPALAEKVVKVVEKWTEGVEWVVDL